MKKTGKTSSIFHHGPPALHRCVVVLGIRAGVSRAPERAALRARTKDTPERNHT